jgi:hypothetical protein
MFAAESALAVAKSALTVSATIEGIAPLEDEAWEIVVTVRVDQATMVAASGVDDDTELTVTMLRHAQLVGGRAGVDIAVIPAPKGEG